MIHIHYVRLLSSQVLVNGSFLILLSGSRKIENNVVSKYMRAKEAPRSGLLRTSNSAANRFFSRTRLV